MPDPISWAADWPYFALTFIAAYLLGSVPFGLVVTRLGGLGDVRNIGSGNIGATNVLRTGRKDLAALTFLGDALKGTVAVLIAYRFGGPDLGVTAALGAFVGHLYPVWLRFKGGKGVATYVGCLLGVAPAVVPVFAVIWIGCAYLSRYSSLSALLASFAVPFACVFLGQIQAAEVFGVLTALVWIKHTPNIKRLLRGEESRIGESKSAS